SLSLTTRVGTVTDKSIAFLANEASVIEVTFAVKLIGDSDVIDGFLDLVGISLILGIEKVKSLIEERPETASAEFTCLAELDLGFKPVGFGRELAELGDGDGSTDVLPIVAIKLPC